MKLSQSSKNRSTLSARRRRRHLRSKPPAPRQVIESRVWYRIAPRPQPSVLDRRRTPRRPRPGLGAAPRLPPQSRAQLVQQCPGRLMIADPRVLLELQRRDPLLVPRQEEGPQKPPPQRLADPGKHRARRHRGLAPTVLTLPPSGVRVASLHVTSGREASHSDRHTRQSRRPSFLRASDLAPEVLLQFPFLRAHIRMRIRQALLRREWTSPSPLSIRFGML